MVAEVRFGSKLCENSGWRPLSISVSRAPRAGKRLIGLFGFQRDLWGPDKCQSDAFLLDPDDLAFPD